MQEKFKWPPGSILTFSTARGKSWLTSQNRELDLADTLMLHWPHNSRTVYLTILLSNPKGKWARWCDTALKHVESLIHYDLGFDAYRVRITQLSKSNNPPCNEAFRWKLQIRAL